MIWPKMHFMINETTKTHKANFGLT